MTRHVWTDEQVEYLKKIAEGTPRKEIVKKLNDKFSIVKKMIYHLIF